MDDRTEALNESVEMVRAFAMRKRRAYLDAVDAERRRLNLRLTSNDLLRKPSTVAQRRPMHKLAGDLGDQARTQMREQRRRAFRGNVAIEIDLHAIGVPQPAASPPAVKAYLDLLQGIAYEDDRAVGYLRVTRHASDNPLFRNTPGDWIYSGGAMPRFPHGPQGHVEVHIAIQPLRTYVADFDRVFELRDEVFGDEVDDSDAGGAEFFRTRFDHFADSDRLDELEDEDRDEAERKGPWAPNGLFATNPDLFDNHRRMRRAALRGLRRKLLLTNGPKDLDRPGPPSAAYRWLWQHDPTIRSQSLDDLFGPGCFLLPPPPTTSGGPSWRHQLRTEMASLHGRWRILDVLVGAPVALDIAVRLPSQFNARDLDNLARDVVVPFEEEFCANHRGAVASYRVYQADLDTGRPGVRVLVIGDERLAAFERAVDRARSWALVRGPRLDDE